MTTHFLAFNLKAIMTNMGGNCPNCWAMYSYSYMQIPSVYQYGLTSPCPTNYGRAIFTEPAGINK